MKIRLTAAMVGGALLGAALINNVQAFEGDVSPYPAGAIGTNIADMPPFPGIFALEQLNYAYANGLYGNDGNKLPIPFRLTVFSATTRFLAAYPVSFYGVNVYSQLVIPVVSLHSSVMGQSATQNGLSNITVTPVLLRWSPMQALSIAGGVDLALETGSYSPTKSSVAVGYLSTQPVLSVRYNVPDGIDLGLSNRLLFNQTNSATHYKSGTGYIGEFEAGWNFGPWKVGFVGAYLDQISDDEVDGVAIPAGGNRARTFGIGPSIAYVAGPLNINLNYQQGVYAVNSPKSSSIWLNFAIPL